MRKLILSILLLYIPVLTIAQCNNTCETINRADGAIVQCRLKMIAYDNTTQVGLGASSNEEANFVSMMVRFKDSAQNITENLTIRTKDNNLITLTIMNSDLAMMGNSQTAQAVFLITNEQFDILRNSEVLTLSFKLDGLLRTYQGEMDTDVLVKQLRCL